MHKKKSGIVTSASFEAYSEEVLAKVNTILDSRAEYMKSAWMDTYSELEAHMDDGWSIDLTQKDFAVLYEGSDIRTQRAYRLPWSLSGVKNAAKYVADCLVPTLESDLK